MSFSNPIFLKDFDADQTKPAQNRFGDIALDLPSEVEEVEEEKKETTVSGLAKALGFGLAKGGTTGISEMGGSAAEFIGAKTGATGLKSVGKGLKEWSQEKEKEWFGDPEQYSTPERIVYEGTSMLGPSLVPGGALTTGFRYLLGAGKLVKAAKAADAIAKATKNADDILKATEAIAKATTATKQALSLGSATNAIALFGTQQAQNTIDNAKQTAARLRSVGDEEGAVKAEQAAEGWTPWVTGAIEAAGEYLGTKYLGKLFGLSDDVAKNVSKKELAKQFIKTFGVEVGTEMGQSGGESFVEKVSGARPEAEPLNEMIEVIGPTAVMTILTGGLAAGASKLQGKESSISVPTPTPTGDTDAVLSSINDALTDGSITPEAVRAQSTSLIEEFGVTPEDIEGIVSSYEIQRTTIENVPEIVPATPTIPTPYPGPGERTYNTLTDVAQDFAHLAPEPVPVGHDLYPSDEEAARFEQEAQTARYQPELPPSYYPRNEKKEADIAEYQKKLRQQKDYPGRPALVSGVPVSSEEKFQIKIEPKTSFLEDARDRLGGAVPRIKKTVIDLIAKPFQSSKNAELFLNELQKRGEIDNSYSVFETPDGKWQIQKRTEEKIDRLKVKQKGKEPTALEPDLPTKLNAAVGSTEPEFLKDKSINERVEAVVNHAVKQPSTTAEGLEKRGHKEKALKEKLIAKRNAAKLLAADGKITEKAVEEVLFPEKKVEDFIKGVPQSQHGETEVKKPTEEQRKVAEIIPNPFGKGFVVKVGKGYVGGGAGPLGGGTIGTWSSVEEAREKGTAHLKKDKWEVKISDQAKEIAEQPSVAHAPAEETRPTIIPEDRDRIHQFADILAVEQETELNKAIKDKDPIAIKKASQTEFKSSLTQEKPNASEIHRAKREVPERGDEREGRRREGREDIHRDLEEPAPGGETVTGGQAERAGVIPEEINHADIWDNQLSHREKMEYATIGRRSLTKQEALKLGNQAAKTRWADLDENTRENAKKQIGRQALDEELAKTKTTLEPVQVEPKPEPVTKEVTPEKYVKAPGLSGQSLSSVQQVKARVKLALTKLGASKLLDSGKVKVVQTEKELTDIFGRERVKLAVEIYDKEEPLVIYKDFLEDDADGYYDDSTNTIYISTRLEKTRQEEILRHEKKHAEQRRKGGLPLNKFVSPQESIAKFMDYFSDPAEVFARAEEKGEEIGEIWEEVFKLRKGKEPSEIKIEKISEITINSWVPERPIPIRQLGYNVENLPAKAKNDLLEIAITGDSGWHTRRLTGSLRPTDPKPKKITKKAIRLHLANRGNGIIAASKLKKFGFEASSGAPFTVDIPITEDNIKKLGELKDELQDVLQLPDTQIKYAKNSSILGATYNGVSYLVADNLDASNTVSTLIHELVHGEIQENGWKGLLGKRYDEVKKQIEQMLEAKHNALVAAQKQAKAAGTREENLLEETITYYVGASAHVEQGLFKRILATINAWLIRHGIKRTIKAEDLVDLAQTAVRRRQTNVQEQMTFNQFSDVNNMIAVFAKEFRISVEMAQRLKAGWTDKRINAEINYAAYDDGRTRAVIGFINPKDFLAATTPNKSHAEDISRSTKLLDIDKMRREVQSPYLIVEEDGHIINHEGRHRMFALAKAGVTSAPIVLDYRRPGVRKDIQKIELIGQTNQFGQEGEELTVSGIIPLTFENRDRLKLLMAEDNIRFSKAEMIRHAKALYSKLEDVTTTVFQSMKAQGVKNFLAKQGVKKVEMDAIGLDAFLAERKPSDKVTKQELLDFVRAHTVELEDVVLGKRKLNVKDYKAHKNSDGKWLISDISNKLIGYSNKDTKEEAIADALSFYDIGNETHFSEYTEPGAIKGSYREMFVTLTQRNLEKTKWGFDDHYGDLHYFDTEALAISAREKKKKEWLANGSSDVFFEKNYGKIRKQKFSNWQDGHPQYSDIKNPVIRIRFNEVADTEGRKILRIEELQGPDPTNQAKMPSYLRDNIYQLGVKRILAYAKENGFDGVALATKPGMTPGETQAARYDISKQVQHIAWEKNDDGTYNISAPLPDGSPGIYKENLTEKEVVELVGKDIAKKIDAGEGRPKEDSPHRNWKIIEGENLALGGAGLKTLYDITLPKMLEAYGGGKMEMATIEIDDRVELNTNPIILSIRAKLQQHNLVQDITPGALRRKYGGVPPWMTQEEWGYFEMGTHLSHGKVKGDKSTMPFLSITSRTPASYPMFAVNQIVNTKQELSPQEISTVEKGLTGKTVTEGIDWLIENDNSPARKEIAKAVKVQIEKIQKRIPIDLKIAHVGDQVPIGLAYSASGLVSYTYGKEGRATIWLNGADVTGRIGTTYETALHEYVHLATMAAIRGGNMKLFAGTAEGNAVARLYDLTNFVIKQFNDKVNSGKTLTEFEQKVYSRQINALLNPQEVVAWGLSSKDMQDHLKSIKYKESSAWSIFVKKIRKLLGIDEKYHSAFDELLSVSDILLQADIDSMSVIASEKEIAFSGPMFAIAPDPKAEAFMEKLRRVYNAKKTRIMPSKVVRLIDRYEDLVKTLKDDKKDIYAKQKALEKHIKASLPNSEQFRVLHTIKSIASVQGADVRERRMQAAIARVEEAHQRVAKKQAINSILETLKKTKPGKGKVGEPKSKRLSAEANARLKIIREAIVLSSEEVLRQRAALFARMESPMTEQGGMEEASASELEKMVLIGTFSDLKGKSLEQLQRAETILNTIIEDGKLEWITAEAERAVRVDGLLNTTAKEFSGGEGAKKPNTMEKERLRAGLWSKIGEKLRAFDDVHQSFEWLLDKLSRYDVESGPLRGKTTEYFAAMVHAATHGEQKGIADLEKQFYDKLLKIYGSPKEVTKRTTANTVKTETDVFIESKTIVDALEGTTWEESGDRSYALMVDDQAAGTVFREEGGWKTSDGSVFKRISEAKKYEKKTKVIPWLRSSGRVGAKEKMVLSQNTGYKLWQMFQQPSIREEMEAHGYTAETLKQLEKFLSPEVKEWAQWQIDEFFPEYRESINVVHRAMFYLDMENIEKYSPISRQYEGQRIDDPLLMEGGLFSSTIPSSAKLRTKNMRGFNILDGDMVLMKHITEMEHFKAWAIPVREMRSVLGSEKIQTIINQFHGNTANNTLKKFVNNFASGGTDRATTIQFLDRVRSRFTTSVIGFTPVITLKQITAMPSYVMEIPTSAWLSGMADFWTHPVEVWDTLMNTSYAKARYKIGMERDVMLALQRARTTSKHLTGKQSLIDYLMLNVKLGDKISVVLGGWPLYRYEKMKAEKTGMSPAEAHKKAYTAFERATDRSLQAANVKDLAAIQQTGSLGKLFTMFMSQPRQYYANASAGLRNLIAGRGTKTENLKRFFVSWVALPVIFQLVSSPFLTDDDDEWDEKQFLKLIRAAITGPLNGLFIAGEIIENMTSALFEGQIFWGDQAIPLLSAPAKGTMAMLRAHKLLDEGWDFDVFVEMATLLGAMAGNLSGLPVELVARYGKNVIDVVEGETEKPGRALLGYSPYARGEEKN